MSDVVPLSGSVKARASGIADRIHFTGHRNDARDLLADFDVFVNCSITEGVSLTILEAMAARLPVVATKVGGTPEVVTDGENGILIPPRRSDILRDALHSLRHRQDWGRDLGAAARRRFESCFTIHRMVDAYARLYLGGVS